uniref:(northern house mosquito) hypothetical protein n=1 Tax=Culex pipiens TaxID=7175 RepID=A0A8D8MU77_CULPI
MYFIRPFQKQHVNNIDSASGGDFRKLHACQILGLITNAEAPVLGFQLGAVTHQEPQVLGQQAGQILLIDDLLGARPRGLYPALEAQFHPEAERIWRFAAG